MQRIVPRQETEPNTAHRTRQPQCPQRCDPLTSGLRQPGRQEAARARGGISGGEAASALVRQLADVAGRDPRAPFGLDLSDGVAYGKLVGVMSVQIPALPRVLPGNPDSSYVVWKIEGDLRISGLRMPRGRPALSQSDIDAIRTWITDGAEDN